MQSLKCLESVGPLSFQITKKTSSFGRDESLGNLFAHFARRRARKVPPGIGAEKEGRSECSGPSIRRKPKRIHCSSDVAAKNRIGTRYRPTTKDVVYHLSCQSIGSLLKSRVADRVPDQVSHSFRGTTCKFAPEATVVGVD